MDTHVRSFGVVRPWRFIHPTKKEVDIHSKSNCPRGQLVVADGARERAPANRILELDPLNETVRSNASFVYLRNGDLDNARREVHRGIELGGLRLQTLKTLGDIHFFGFSDSVSAIQLYQKAGQSDAAWNGAVAGIYGSLGDQELAERWFRQLRIDFPDEAWGYVAEMEWRFRAGDTEVGLAMAETALEMAQDTLPAVVPIASLLSPYLEQGRADDLMDIFVTRYPQLLYDEPQVHDANINAAVYLVTIHKWTGNDETATDLANRIIEASSDWPRMGAFGATATTAQAYARTGRISEAITEYTRLLDAGWLMIGADLVLEDVGLQELRNDPAFQTILDRNTEMVARQLADIRSLAADGKIAEDPDQLSDMDIDISSLVE